MKLSVKPMEEGTITDKLQKTLEDIIDSKIEERLPSAVAGATAVVQKQDVQQVHRGKVIDRTKNLIVFKEDEGDGTEDMAKVMGILADKLGLPDLEQEAISRLGKKTANQSRPIKITMKSVEDKSSVLNKLKEMRESKVDILKSIFITPDLSKSERDKQKSLRAALRERRRKGENDLIIRRGRIVSAVEQSQPSGSRDG